jgi:hypothetical protein
MPFPASHVDTEPSATFDGTNPETLLDIITLAELAFLQDDDYDEKEEAKCARIASRFRGPALQWIQERRDATTDLFSDYSTFVTTVRNEFGATRESLATSRRLALEALRWNDKDLPLFFVEFDRLTRLTNQTADATRIALLHPKLPLNVRRTLAEQALDIVNYTTLRDRLLLWWQLDPARSNPASGTGTRKKKCSRCHKKGHTADVCHATIPAPTKSS